jgi:FtsP/CotA-like multicopper oxidase with cupredoxin domain
MPHVAGRCDALLPRLARGIWVHSVCLSFFMQPAMAEDGSPKLDEPPICSEAAAAPTCAQWHFTVIPLGNGHNKLQVDLTAEKTLIEVGGYKVTTENYNGNYLTPVIEAMPGDKVAAHLVNILPPRSHDGMRHGDADENPTNLHYFHGGIVSPHNARALTGIDASQGNGDNIYVYLKNGKGDAAPYFDFEVPIPGENELDARVLDRTGHIAHPLGLNWYHSHLHHISSDQVMGGMSGLLSVGDAKANVAAACDEDPDHLGKCKNDIEKDTLDLKRRTDPKYVLLRDIPLRSISTLPEEANGAPAEPWAPADRDFPGKTRTDCGVWNKKSGQLDLNPKLRKGYCQRDQDSAWLFTLNGQRFPTIYIEGGRNVLLRTGNLSANVAYWLEAYRDSDEKDILNLELLSLDGVVPVNPRDPVVEKIPVKLEFKVKNLLLMPATRAEIYVRNDFYHDDERVYVLRTKGADAGPDKWPEIQLARIVLKRNLIASPTLLALNAPIVQPSLFAAPAQLGPEAAMPPGCVRDLLPEKSEHRRVTFTGPDQNQLWGIITEIVHPPKDDPAATYEESDFVSPPDQQKDKTTIGDAEGFQGVPFEDYELKDGGTSGRINWEGINPPHVCIKLDHVGSHDQLWVLRNFTGALHNFHIHQIKFRLATGDELKTRHICPPTASVSPCTSRNCSQPEYKLYETDSKKPPEWHDTIPIPPNTSVFLIMSFDAQEQVGRFVFHCHILKHEDNGLMAPIEVWDPHPPLVDR